LALAGVCDACKQGGEEKSNLFETKAEKIMSPIFPNFGVS